MNKKLLSDCRTRISGKIFAIFSGNKFTGSISGISEYLSGENGLLSGADGGLGGGGKESQKKYCFY